MFHVFVFEEKLNVDFLWLHFYYFIFPADWIVFQFIFWLRSLYGRRPGTVSLNMEGLLHWNLVPLVIAVQLQSFLKYS